jgi:chromosome partitioning protein
LVVVETVQDRLGHDLKVLGILPTRVDRRNWRVTEHVLNELAELYGELVFDNHIPINSFLARAQIKGVPVFDLDPSGNGATAYKELAGEVLQRIKAAN